jgi:hypothetical protein
MYIIQKHPFDFTTGVDKYGNQILMGLIYPYIVTILFDANGFFLELRMKLVLFQAKSIHKNGPYMTEEPEFELKLKEQMQRWQSEFDFQEQKISIRYFFLKEFSLGIEDLPKYFQQFQQNPDEFNEEEKREYPKLIADWKSEENFVLWWGKDYFINKEGEII